MLDVTNLHVTYGRSVKALQGVSLTVEEGTVLAVLGTNGAGKTTLMRSISGTLAGHRARIVEGSIMYKGDRISGLEASRVMRRGVVQSPEGRRVFATLTVDENLRLAAYGARLSKQNARAAHDRVVELFPRLAERGRQSAGLMSGGEQQMLAIGRALMAEPDLLLLDEPSLGLAPQVVARIAAVVEQINRQGTTVMLVEQNANMALAVSQEAVVLDTGRVSLTGRSSDLTKSPRVRELYLGHAASADDPVAPQTEERDEAPGGSIQ